MSRAHDAFRYVLALGQGRVLALDGFGDCWRPSWERYVITSKPVVKDPPRSGALPP